MENKMENQLASLEGYYSGIMTYITVERPTVKETLHFLGALINSTLDGIKLTTTERETYMEIYNTLIRNKIFNAPVIKDPKNIEQPELAHV